MLSIQHILYAKLIKPELSSKDIASVVYPDAIRAYVGARQYTHFEMSPDKNDVSYWTFPSDLKATKEDVLQQLQTSGYLVPNIPSCVLGEDTNILVFREQNKHLPSYIFQGVEWHLKQDIVFDDFIRFHIDCSDKYNDNFYFNGTKLNGKEVRGLIADIEQYGIYMLAKYLYEEQGITVNQKWLENNIKPALEAEYPFDLAEKTFSFMNISPEINKLISEHDWSGLQNAPLTMEAYESLYDDVLEEMSKDYDLEENLDECVSCINNDFRTENDISI